MPTPTRGTHKLPPGSHLRTPWYEVSPGEVELLFDLTFLDSSGSRFVEQQIFDAVFELIEQAEHYLVLDFFLYNDFAGDAASAHRALSSELTERLVAAKCKRPELAVLLITDPDQHRLRQ